MQFTAALSSVVLHAGQILAQSQIPHSSAEENAHGLVRRKRRNAEFGPQFSSVFTQARILDGFTA